MRACLLQSVQAKQNKTKHLIVDTLPIYFNYITYFVSYDLIKLYYRTCIEEKKNRKKVVILISNFCTTIRNLKIENEINNNPLLISHLFNERFFVVISLWCKVFYCGSLNELQRRDLKFMSHRTADQSAIITAITCSIKITGWKINSDLMVI